MNYGTEIILDGRVVARSHNLRGMRDYARVSPVVRVETRKLEGSVDGGSLLVTYANGAKCHGEFYSHGIMIDFVRERRSWRTAEIVHFDGDYGYFTSPGELDEH